MNKEQSQPVAALGQGTITRRDFLKLSATAAASGWLLAACGPAPQGSGDKETYTGEVFDAQGATLTIGIWGGEWTTFEQETLLNQFEQDFNCKIVIDNGPVFYTKLVAGGVDDPGLDLVNQNLSYASRTQQAGFLVPVKEVKANVPNATDCWDFAFQGTGIIRLWSMLGLGYHTETVDPLPTKWADLWQDRFANKRGTYIIANPLAQIFFMLAAQIFGQDQTDIQAGLKAMEDLKPIKVTDFTMVMAQWLEQGEVEICYTVDGDPYRMADNGISVNWVTGREVKPALFQNVSVTKGSKQKRLAYALLNRMLDPEIQAQYAQAFYMRPVNEKTLLPQNLTSHGIKNSEDETGDLWIPDWNWWNENSTEISEEYNKIMQA
jgi:putative spermidine/putrescine transport system substrate-binding protein